MIISESIDKIIFWAGAIFISIKILSLFSWLTSILMKTEKNLLERYGEKSYVLITGASDGIGKALAFRFALRGFNLVLVARNKTKIDEVKKEILNLYPKTDIRVILADFQFCIKETFFTDIMDMIKDLDVSILVNNVGVLHSNYLTKLKEEQIKEMILTNCIPQAILTQRFIPLMQARTKKSAIITLSSLSSKVSVSGLQTYGATKSFNDYFSHSLGVEYPEIDSLSIQPSFIETNMTKDIKSPMTVKLDDFADSVFKLIGNNRQSYGVFLHEFIGKFIELIPRTLVEKFMNKKKKSKGKSNEKDKKDK